MLFHNITIGSTVMFNKDKKAMDKAFKDGYFYAERNKHICNEHTVVDVYSTFFNNNMTFRPRGLFQIGLAIRNRTGHLEYVGIRSVKPVLVIEE